jgi:hypothetical protein
MTARGTLIFNAGEGDCLFASVAQERARLFPSGEAGTPTPAELLSSCVCNECVTDCACHAWGDLAPDSNTG